MVHASAEHIQTHAEETGGTEETLWQRVCAANKEGRIDEFMVANRAEFERSQASPPSCVGPLPTPTIKRECTSARPPVGGTLPPYLSGPPVFLLHHAARTICVALEMKVRDPSIRRCRAWPPC